MEYKRLTARSPKNNMAYLVNVRPNEQAVDSIYPDTLKCILDSFERLAAYEDSGLWPFEVQELANIKAEERLVMLPCKVGDTLYWVAKKRNDHGTHDKHIESSVVIRIWSEGDGYWWITAGGMNRRCDCIGKTFFLTKESAEKALAGGVQDANI
jgi:hypothetical protein